MNKKVQEVLDSAESIGSVKASPFFKEGVMRQIHNVSNEKELVLWSWFTPKLQLVTLTCVIVLNIVAYTKLKEITYYENVNSFAESYGLLENNESSILN